MFKIVRILACVVALLWPTVCHGLVTYYVDPTYTDDGSDATGSAADPWTAIAWASVSASLAGDDVTVYFSARTVASDSDETVAAVIALPANATGNTLTLDGMSKYNTNDAHESGSWVDYSGAAKYCINAPASTPITTGANEPSNVVIRGFRITSHTSSQALYYRSGSDVVISHIFVNGNDAGGGGILVPDYNDTNSAGSNLTVQYCDIQGCVAEHLYISGNKDSAEADNHDAITVQYNHIHSPGSSGQRDGIDIKDCITNLIVRGNIIDGMTEKGITSLSPGLFSKNLVQNCTKEGIHVNAYWGQGSGGWASGGETRLYNNLVLNCNGYGIAVDASEYDIPGAVTLYNNTIHCGGLTASRDAFYFAGGVGGEIITSLVTRNNLTDDSASRDDFRTDGTIGTQDNDYNCLLGSTTNYTGGAHDIADAPKILSDGTPSSGSPVVGAGTDLSAYFTTDYSGRSWLGRWGIGARVGGGWVDIGTGPNAVTTVPAGTPGSHTITVGQ